MSELAIVLGAGVDRTPDNKVQLTLQLARPAAFAGGAESGGGASPEQNITWTISETGDTILEAERSLALKVGRNIYWAHGIILVLGEEAAKAGVRNYIDFFMRDPMPRETTWVLVTKGKAKTILESHAELEKTSAQATGFILRNNEGIGVRLKDYAIALAARGTNPTLPLVELEQVGEVSGPGMDKPKQHEGVSITGLGVFKDEYLVGWLDIQETRGLLWLRGDMGNYIITIPSPGQPDKMLSIDIVGVKTKVEPQFDGGKISFDVNLSIKGELSEQQSTEDLSIPEKIVEIEEAMAEDAANKCLAALEKAQGEYGSDIFGFGEAFHRKYKREYKELKYSWNEVFKDAQVNIAIEARVQRVGLLNRPVTIKRP
jgi:spore germination protein KC